MTAAFLLFVTLRGVSCWSLILCGATKLGRCNEVQIDVDSADEACSGRIDCDESATGDSAR